MPLKKSAGFYPDERAGNQKAVYLPVWVATAASIYWGLATVASATSKLGSVLPLSQEA
jgi:hypothetical protein